MLSLRLFAIPAVKRMYRHTRMFMCTYSWVGQAPLSRRLFRETGSPVRCAL